MTVYYQEQIISQLHPSMDLKTGWIVDCAEEPKLLVTGLIPHYAS